MVNIDEFIKALPKAELHLHIEGSLEPDLMFKLAHRNNLTLPYQSVEEIQQAYNFNNLQDFLDIYYAGAGVLLTQQDFYDLTWAYLLRCKEDNVVHTEIFFDPQTHTERGIDFDIVITGIHEALQEGEKTLGITSHIIMCFLRHLSEDSAFEVLEQAKPFQSLIVGVGLDSSEIGNPPEKFKRVFEQAIQQGYLPVAHAGEEGDSSYIWGALDHLKVKRVDHGVQSLSDQQLMQRLVSDQIPLTVCPLSNIKLCVFSSLKDHNLKAMLDAGVCVTINSDDPAYFGGYMNKNYSESSKALHLSIFDLADIAKNSFKAAFMESSWKDKKISEIDQLLKTYQ